MGLTHSTGGGTASQVDCRDGGACSGHAATTRTKGQEPCRLPFSTLASIFRLSGWEGDTEVAFREYFQDAVYPLVKTSLSIRLFVFLLYLARNLMKFPFAIPPELKVVLPNVLILVVLNRNRVSECCAFDGTCRWLIRISSIAGLSQTSEFFISITQMKMMYATHELGNLYCESGLLLMPWGLLLALIFIPVDFYLGYSIKTVLCLAIFRLAVKVLMELHHRRQFVQNSLLTVLAGNRQQSQPLQDGRFQPGDATAEGSDDDDDDDDDEEEEEEGYFSELADCITCDAEGICECTTVQSLEGIRNWVCIDASTLTYSPDKLFNLTAVHVYIDWEDPSQVKPEHLLIFESRLEEELDDSIVLASLARRGSLIITLDVLDLQSRSPAYLADKVRNVLVPKDWLELLDLTPVMNGQQIVVQVGNQATVLRWKKGAWTATETACAPIGAPVSIIKHVDDQVRTIELRAVGVQSDVQPSAHKVEIHIIASGELMGSVSKNSAKASILRARYLGSSLPVEISDISAYQSCTDGLGESVATSQEEFSMMATVVLPHESFALHANKNQMSRVITLEVWKDRMVTQSVPVLVLSEDRKMVSCELMRAVESQQEPELGKESQGKNMLNQTLTKLGIFLQVIDKLRGQPVPSGDARCDPRFLMRIIYLGYQLLEQAIHNAWLETASSVLDGLISTLGCKWTDFANGTNQQGLSLLHLAVLSGKASLVATVLEWGRRNGALWTWNVTDVRGMMPMHYMAMKCDERMVKCILKHFPSARLAWSKLAGRIGYSAEELAKARGMDTKQLLPKTTKDMRASSVLKADRDAKPWYPLPSRLSVASSSGRLVADLHAAPPSPTCRMKSGGEAGQHAEAHSLVSGDEPTGVTAVSSHECASCTEESTSLPTVSMQPKCSSQVLLLSASCLIDQSDSFLESEVSPSAPLIKGGSSSVCLETCREGKVQGRFNHLSEPQTTVEDSYKLSSKKSFVSKLQDRLSSMLSLVEKMKTH